jgi:hypothetical protein
VATGIAQHLPKLKLNQSQNFTDKGCVIGTSSSVHMYSWSDGVQIVKELSWAVKFMWSSCRYSRQITLVALHIHQAGIDCLVLMSLHEYVSQENGG